MIKNMKENKKKERTLYEIKRTIIYTIGKKMNCLYNNYIFKNFYLLLKIIIITICL